MKLIISTIVTGVVFFLLGWLLWGIIFGDYFSKHYAAVSRGEDMKVWAMAVSNFLLAFFMALIYPKGFKGGSPFSEGFKFGIYMALLMAVPFVFMFWSSMNVPYQAAILDGILYGILVVIGGVIIGLIYGKQEKPTS